MKLNYRIDRTIFIDKSTGKRTFGVRIYLESALSFEYYDKITLKDFESLNDKELFYYLFKTDEVGRLLDTLIENEQSITIDGKRYDIDWLVVAANLADDE